MIGLGDFACYNATVFYKEVLSSDLPAEFKTKNLESFFNHFSRNPQNQRLIVRSEEEAREYVKNHQMDLGRADVLYLTQDYKVIRLN